MCVLKTLLYIWLIFLNIICINGSIDVLNRVASSSNEAFDDNRQLRHDSIFVHPQQIHLSLADDGHSMVVTWSTLNSTTAIGGSFVRFGKDPRSLTRQSVAKETVFVDGGALKSTQYIHRALMDNLQPNTTYFYHVGNDVTLSDFFFFKTFPDPESSWSLSIALYGDMGNVNAQSMVRLQEDTQSGMYDMILHVGDFAYDMDSDNAKVGDEFMRQIEAVAAYIPYMTCPGNHEQAYNFSNYKNRFTMPENKFGDMFYSFDLGPVHFISIDTEFYYFLNYGFHPVIRQYNWLVNDLEKANSKENRAKRPWIVIFGHRPMYCTGRDNDDCTHWKTKTRVGIEVPHQKFLYGMEELLIKYGVDVAIWAHEHNYERFWPLNDYQVKNGSRSEPYTEAKAPIHIITGSAGCDEGREGFIRQPPYYSAFRSMDYGYTRLKAHNKTHLEFSQVSDDQKGAIIDHFYVIKKPL